mmetsp:Transcript_32863/g.79161  ORF Transcript_32863/g.79161 Transcript_32863/m.79161 type:complete len:249 (-) Transcript_32863:28-774(-)
MLGSIRVVVDVTLVDNGVNSNRGLAGLAITNDKLALASSNRDQTVHRLEARHHRLVDRLPGDNPRGLQLNSAALLGRDWALPIDGVAQSVHNAPEQLLADRNIHNGAGSLDGVSFQDGTIITKDHNTHVVCLQVQGHSLESGAELNHLSSLYLLQPVDTGDTISHRQHTANLTDFLLISEVADTLLQDLGQLGWAHLRPRSRRRVNASRRNARQSSEAAHRPGNHSHLGERHCCRHGTWADHRPGVGA